MFVSKQKLRICVLATVKAARTKSKLVFSKKYLLLTNTIISGIQACSGDALEQKTQIRYGEISGWNKSRSRDVALWGLLIGPFCHYWFHFLEWFIPGRSIQIAAKKLVLDQCICSPVVISTFLYMSSYLEGKRDKELMNEVVQKGKTLYIAEWTVWPPAQMINFYFMPYRFRVLFDNMVSLGYSWYYSYVKYGQNNQLPAPQDSTKKEHSVQHIEVDDTNTHGYIHDAIPHVPLIHLQAANVLVSKSS